MLGGFSTSRNETVLHTDEKLLPTRLNARASWNYHVGADDRAATLTYHMNRLQSLAAPEPYCVTLNATGRINARPDSARDDVLPSADDTAGDSRTGALAGDQRTEPHALLRRVLVLRIPRGRPELGHPGGASAGGGLAAGGVMESAIYFGTLRHRRFRPARHEFTYPLFMAYLDVDRIQELMQVSRLASYNGWNWASFNEARPFRRRKKAFARATGGRCSAAWRHICQRERSSCSRICATWDTTSIPFRFSTATMRDGRLQLIMAEVKNTFGETQNYWLSNACQTSASDTSRSYEFAKTLHVSPFMSMACSYHWTFTSPDASLTVQTNVAENNQSVFDGTLKLARRPWSAQWLRYALMRLPVGNGQDRCGHSLGSRASLLEKSPGCPPSGARTFHPRQHAPGGRSLEHRMKYPLPKRLFLQLLERTQGRLSGTGLPGGDLQLRVGERRAASDAGRP